MELLNLQVDRIIIHQIYKRNQEGAEVPPTKSSSFTRFDPAAMVEFKSRIGDALGQGSAAVEMEIASQEADDLAVLIDQMIDQPDKEFKESSFLIARKLTRAQSRRNIPGGIVVVFSGRQGQPQKRYVGVIKAEIHSAYEKEVHPQTQEISLNFIQEVLLTPGTRLYKTIGFFERADAPPQVQNLNDKWVVMISDYQIGKSDGKVAAEYFYSGFAGCGYPQTSARTTMQFYDSTVEFISGMDLPEEQKSDLYNALTTYLKVNAAPTASAQGFADLYFADANIKDGYIEHISDAGLPIVAFLKDTSHIESKLKYRRVNFSSNIKIVAPAQAFKDLVSLEYIDGDLDEAGTPMQWTRVTIKDKITSQQ